jgi:hypothetical protein
MMTTRADGARGKGNGRTDDSVLLETRCSSIEDKDGLDAMEEELVNPTEEAEDVSIRERAAFLVLHRCLEL